MKFSSGIKKICVCSEFPPPYGGIGLQAKLLADCLDQEEGLEVCCISTTLPDNYLGMLLSKLKVIKSLFRMFLFIFRCLFGFSKASIVHILSGSYLNFFIFTFPAVLLAKIFKKSIVIHYHGGAAGDFLKEWGLLARPVLKMADVIVVPSGFLEQIFHKHGIPTTVIPNIIPLDNFIFKKREIFKPRMLMTRHLEPIYNISCAIRGFSLLIKEFPEATLTIAGSGSERNKLEKLACDLGCRAQVNFLGAIDSDKIDELYNDNDILLNTSSVDNLPLSILEGFACGLLIVSTKAGGIPYIIEHEVNGMLIDLDDYQGVVDSIMWLLDNQELSRKIALKAHGDVSCFAWTQIGPILLKLYERLI